MNCAGDAVVEFGVELGELVAGVDGGVGDIPDSCGLDDVPDDELADGLILGAGLGAVGAPHVLDVSAAVLGASIVAAFRGHLQLEQGWQNFRRAQFSQNAAVSMKMSLIAKKIRQIKRMLGQNLNYGRCQVLQK